MIPYCFAIYVFDTDFLFDFPKSKCGEKCNPTFKKTRKTLHGKKPILVQHETFRGLTFYTSFYIKVVSLIIFPAPSED